MRRSANMLSTATATGNGHCNADKRATMSRVLGHNDIVCLCVLSCFVSESIEEKLMASAGTKGIRERSNADQDERGRDRPDN